MVLPSDCPDYWPVPYYLDMTLQTIIHKTHKHKKKNQDIELCELGPSIRIIMPKPKKKKKKLKLKFLKSNTQLSSIVHRSYHNYT